MSGTSAEEGGVFEHLTELTDVHGWNAIEKMTASELIKAVAELDRSRTKASPNSTDDAT
jgi:hypothetical protein